MPLDEQAFQTQVLGEVHVSPTGGLTVDHLDGCRQDYIFDDYDGAARFMCVDVGKYVLHVVVREAKEPHRLVYIDEVAEFEELSPIKAKFNVRRCVIDGLPDSHATRLYALEHRSTVALGGFDRVQPGNHSVPAKGDQPWRVHINRNEAFDSMTYRFRHGELALPRDARSLGRRMKNDVGEYYRELMTPVSVLEQNEATGNFSRTWLSSNRADHYAHAELYCAVARELGSTGGTIGRITLLDRPSRRPTDRRWEFV